MTGSLVERLQLAIMNEAQLLGIHSLNLDHAETLARAAIEAMREPTPEMINAARSTPVFATCDWDGSEALLLPDVEGGSGGIQTLWRAMITAAIGEKE
jgi:hypothetical protein